MAFKLELTKTNNTPYILVDEEKEYMRMEGECFLEDIVNFFSDVSRWLEEYLSSGSGGLTFDCALEYFNSSTTKLLYNMLCAMDEYAGKGRKMTVNWIAVKGDDMIIECGEDFKDEMENLDFNLVIN